MVPRCVAFSFFLSDYLGETSNDISARLIPKVCFLHSEVQDLITLGMPSGTYEARDSSERNILRSVSFTSGSRFQESYLIFV